MAEGTMFCTGHTSMTINELVSYTALIRTEFLDEYKMAHGMMVKKGPGRAKVDDPTPTLVPTLAPPLSLPCTLSLHAPSTTTLTHSHPHPHSPSPALAIDARLGGGAAGSDSAADHRVRRRQGLPWGQTSTVQQGDV